MILFYAWTDTQIINAVNVKENRYKGKSADLIIYKLKRISEDVIYSLKGSNVFENVYILYPPKNYLERKRKSISEKLESICLGSRYRMYFDTMLRDLLGEKKYEVFLTGAFWSETVLVIRYIKKFNSEIKIWFYEEGLAAYNGPPNWLFQTVPDKSIKATVRMLLYYGISSYKYRKYVKGIYMYKPELSNIDNLEVIHIPPILKNSNPVCYEICKGISYGKKDIYEECDIIYIAEAPNMKSEKPLESIYRILDVIFDVLSHAKVVLKTHPIMQSLGIEFDVEKYANLYVDKSAACIEQILFDVDIDNKIVVTGNSTSALYIKWVYMKTPYMIIFNGEYARRLVEYVRRYVKNYEHNKAYASRSIDEFKEILRILPIDKRSLVDHGGVK